MIAEALDSSVLVAAIAEAEAHHASCATLLVRPGDGIYAHALSEVFNTLTGGRCGYRVPASQAVELLEEGILPAVQVVTLSVKETLAGLREASGRGVSVAAIYDLLHLLAAKKAGAKRLFTLNLSHFQALHRPGDPEIVHPSRR